VVVTDDEDGLRGPVCTPAEGRAAGNGYLSDEQRKQLAHDPRRGAG
jgi:hypothetical protein